MKIRSALLAFAVAGVPGSTPGLAQNAYITGTPSDSVSVIDTAKNTVIATIPVGSAPEGVGVSPDGTRIYVANTSDDTVSVINGTTNTLVATVPVGAAPGGVAVAPDGDSVYIANINDGTLSIIVAKTDTITATVTIPGGVFALAVTPNGRRLYITSPIDTVSVLDTASNAVIATINTGTTSTGAGSLPSGVAVSPDGSKVYVALYASAAVAVIDTATNTGFR